MRTVIVGLAVLLVPVVTRAQTAERPGLWFVPSVRTSVVHQDNVRLTDDFHQQGTFLRVTSTLETSHRGPLHSFQALFAVDSETFAERQLRVFNDLSAQQTAAVRFDSRRSGLVANARYFTTTRPEEVLEATGLIASYRTTKNADAGLGFSRGVTARWRASASYAGLYIDYGQPTATLPSARNLQHALGAAMSLQMSPRTVIALEQSTRVLTGEDLTTRSVTKGVYWDGYAAVRVTHNFTPRVRFTVLAGPRAVEQLPPVIRPLGYTRLQWNYVPEILTALTYRDVGRSVDVRYARTAYLGYGAAGFFETHVIEARLAYVIARRTRLTARPAMYRNSLGTVHARSRRFDGVAAYDISPWLALEAAYLYKYQDRPLTLVDLRAPSPLKPRSRTTLMVGMALTRPMRVN